MTINGNTYTAAIDGVATGGHGVARLEQGVCFVPGALPGDEVRIAVTGRKKGVLWGELVEVVTPSPDRRGAACPVFGRCGGCSWLHFAYPAQGEWKRRIVADCLERIGGIHAPVAWREDPALRLGYRTRASFHGDGVNAGFYARSSHDAVDITACPLCHRHLNEALARLRPLAPRASVEITVNPEDAADVLVHTERPWKALLEEFENVNGARDRRGRAAFMFDGTPVVNGAFSQSSLLLNRLLLRAVQHEVGNARTVLDLYCGAGNLSLGLKTREVTGIDRDRLAVEAAAMMHRGMYAKGDEGTMRAALRQGAWDAVLLDPPRSGAKPIIQDLARADAGRIVYVACDPATLARDLRTLVESGWRVESVTAIDLFPQTPHVETVARLER